MNTLDKLESLLAKATRGPVELISDCNTCAIKVGDAYMPAPYQPPHGRGNCPVWRADGELFAASRNALPALLAVARAAQKLDAATKPDADSEGRRTWTVASDRVASELFEALAALNKEQANEQP